MALLRNRILVGRFNKGDVHALQEIYDLYKTDMMTLATGLLFDKTQAEDVLHEVFAKLIGLQGRMRIRSTLRGYLLRAVANEARTINGTGARKDRARIDERGDSPRNVDPPEHAAALAEERHRLERSLRELPYEQREVILLRHHGQARFKAIAEHQGVSMSAVQARYRRGLKKLRSLLGADL